jgi:CRP-like cAMP-binding protein
MFRNDAQGVPASRLDTLRSLPMFAHYTDADLTRVDALVYETTIPTGTALTVEGQVRRQAFIVLSGEAVATVSGAVIGRLGVGDLIGEMSLLNNQPQSATVTAETALRVLVMDPREFGTWMSDPRAARWLAYDLSERLRVAQTQMSAVAIASDPPRPATTAKNSRATALRGRRQPVPVTAIHAPA